MEPEQHKTYVGVYIYIYVDIINDKSELWDHNDACFCLSLSLTHWQQGQRSRQKHVCVHENVKHSGSLCMTPPPIDGGT